MLTDFDRWLSYHTKAYPGMAKWLKENEDQLRFWRRLLEAYSIDELSSATDRLYAADEQPRGYSEHARAIRRILADGNPVRAESESGPRMVHDHLVADCPQCMDYGSVSVLGPKTLKLLRTTEGEVPLLTCALACDCRRGHGKRLPKWADGYSLVVYEQVLQLAADRACTMCDVARELLVELDTAPTARAMTGEELP